MVDIEDSGRIQLEKAYRQRWNDLLKLKMHIQKLEKEREDAQKECTFLKEKVRSLSQRISTEWNGFRERIK